MCNTVFEIQFRWHLRTMIVCKKKIVYTLVWLIKKTYSLCWCEKLQKSVQ